MLLKLQNFEGPIELLYNLIDERKVDICQISLAEVTDQYLSYIKYYEKTDPKNLAEFLVVAARLILIKSKMLLPTLETTQEEDEEIKDLERKLELYKKLREISKKLKVFTKNSSPEYSREFLISEQTIFLPPKDITGNALLESLKSIIGKIPKQAVQLPEKTLKVVISFEEVIKNLQYRIKNAIHKTFSEATATASKIEVIMHFLAILELIKQKDIIAEQNELFGEIELRNSLLGKHF